MWLRGLQPRETTGRVGDKWSTLLMWYSSRCARKGGYGCGAVAAAAYSHKRVWEE